MLECISKFRSPIWAYSRCAKSQGSEVIRQVRKHLAFCCNLVVFHIALLFFGAKSFMFNWKSQQTLPGLLKLLLYLMDLQKNIFLKTTPSTHILIAVWILGRITCVKFTVLIMSTLHVKSRNEAKNGLTLGNSTYSFLSMFFKMYKIKTEWKTSNVCLGLKDLIISYFLCHLFHMSVICSLTICLHITSNPWLLGISIYSHFVQLRFCRQVHVSQMGFLKPKISLNNPARTPPFRKFSLSYKDVRVWAGIAFSLWYLQTTNISSGVKGLCYNLSPSVGYRLTYLLERSLRLGKPRL